MKINKVKYIHNEITHNMLAPNIIVPMVMDITKINSVVDFGCGIGTWLNAFKNDGVREILGLDGKWVNTDLLYKYISEGEFVYADLEKSIKLDKMYDLVVSLEVAEHISEDYADIFIKSLVDAGNIILFSAAIPGQGGFNHVNEQWPTYWMKKFKYYDYYFHDVIRKKIWNNPEIEYFYKQNIFIVAHKNAKLPPCDSIGYENIIHPDSFTNKVLYINKVETGKRGISYYLLILMKRLKNYIVK